MMRAALLAALAWFAALPALAWFAALPALAGGATDLLLRTPTTAPPRGWMT